MSIFWSTERVGYDGEFMHGQVCLNYWEPREDFERKLEEQLAVVRREALAERDRLSQEMDTG